MSRARRCLSWTDLLYRLLAAGSATLILALTVFAASPDLHGRLHGAGKIDRDDSCAVVLFAAGVSSVLAQFAAQPPALRSTDHPSYPTAEIFLTLPRYLRQPERGPPARA